MTQHRSALFTFVAIASLVVGACTSATSPSPAASAAASTTPSSSAAASPSGVTAGAGGTLTMGLYQAFTSFDP